MLKKTNQEKNQDQQKEMQENMETCQRLNT